MYFNKTKIKSNNNHLNNNEADYPLFILVSLLIISSIIFSYSLTIYTVEFFGYDQFHFFIRQGGVGISAIFIMWYLSRMDPDKIVEKIGMTLFIGCFILMLLMPFLPSFMVTESGGANRWIRFPGFSLSPVEFFKIGFIYFLSWSFYRKVIHKPKKIGLIEEIVLLSPYFLTFFVVVFVIAFLQKDLGQVVLLAIILVVLLIFFYISFNIFLALGTIAVV